MSVDQRPRIFDLAWPALFEMCLAVGVGIVGTIFAARMSDHAGAAFSLANQIATLLFIFYKLVSAGLTIVVAQNLGRGRRDLAEQTARAAIGASQYLGGLIAICTLIGAVPLMQVMQAPVEVAKLAVPFLQMLAPAMWLDALNSALAGVLRAHLKVRQVLVVIALMQVIHLGLAWLFMPSLGLIGFALALCLSRTFGFIAYLTLWKMAIGFFPSWRDWWQLRRAPLLPIVRIGRASMAAEVSYRLAFMASVAAVASLGAESLSAQAYTLQINYAVLLVGLALSIAVEITLGYLIGAGKFREADQLLRRVLLIGLVISLSLAAIAAFSGTWLLHEFTQTSSIINSASQLLWLTVLLEPGRTLNLVLNSGLRASGDADYPAQAGIPIMLVTLAGGSWLFAVILGWGVAGIWVAYAMDEWCRGLLMWRRWRSLAWLPRARQRYRS